MILVLTAVGVLALLLLVLAGMLRALDVLSDRQDKDHLRAKILDFWIRTADLELVDQLHRALENNYVKMRPLRRRFVNLFLCFCLLVIVGLIIEVLSTDTPKLTSARIATIEADFSFLHLINCVAFSDARARKCYPEKDKEIDPPPEFRHQREYTQLVQSSDRAFLVSSEIVGGIVTIVVAALPLSAALLLSMSTTLWILSIITKSRLRFAFLVLIDILVAVVMPPLLTNIFMILMVGFGVLVFGQFMGYEFFNSAGLLSLTLGTVGFGINSSFITPVISFLFVTNLPGLTSIASASQVLLGAIGLAAESAVSFLIDAGKILRLDFSAEILRSTLDWAIFTDLLFSSFFLGPSLVVVLANRSEWGREILLNLVMWVGDHPKGPLVAVAEILSSFVSFLKRLVVDRF